MQCLCGQGHTPAWCPGGMGRRGKGKGAATFPHWGCLHSHHALQTSLAPVVCGSNTVISPCYMRFKRCWDRHVMQQKPAAAAHLAIATCPLHACRLALLQAYLPSDGITMLKVSDSAALGGLMHAVEAGDSEKAFKELGKLLGGDTAVSPVAAVLVCGARLGCRIPPGPPVDQPAAGPLARCPAD